MRQGTLYVTRHREMCLYSKNNNQCLQAFVAFWLSLNNQTTHTVCRPPCCMPLLMQCLSHHGQMTDCLLTSKEISVRAPAPGAQYYGECAPSFLHNVHFLSTWLIVIAQQGVSREGCLYTLSWHLHQRHVALSPSKLTIFT